MAKMFLIVLCCQETLVLYFETAMDKIQLAKLFKQVAGVHKCLMSRAFLKFSFFSINVVKVS
jgi:hypothetical protein